MSTDEPTIHETQQARSAQDLTGLYLNNETSQTVAHNETEGVIFNPQYEMLNRYLAVNSTPYDCLNQKMSENVYKNTILGSTNNE